MNRYLAVFFIGIFFSASLHAQAPRFAKFGVMGSGASLYMPEEPLWELSYSEDSSEVYTTEVLSDSVLYGAIVVKFGESLGDDPEVWENVLVSYLEFLNTEAFEFTSVTDPGYGHTLESHPTARGVLEYGEDEDGTQFAIKGWVDDQFLAILYTGYPEEMNYNVQQMFLQGFRFP
ncbi:MAG: hypothetical protein R3D00_27725 [Bacteroidia bacterium]